MQGIYFQIWLGTWPSCIDWTAAVAGTHVSAALYSFTRSLDYEHTPPAPKLFLFSKLWNPFSPSTKEGGVIPESLKIENEINKYFSQILTYYFGQDAFSLRTQAYDDMLWVVLGWLDNVKFIKLHAEKHYPSDVSQGWYGKQFDAAFAHRARVFYDLASQGWDTTSCGGGMNWNPRLETYKNAITNELFITASINMYLYFPGDTNTSPFDSLQSHNMSQQMGWQELPVARPHDRKYLKSATAAYKWLKDSNMTNAQGLYIDGFHLSDPRTGPKVCDQRNEMVYTYNQGVVLSGLRGLWEATGDVGYLEDGFTLISNVVKATGYGQQNSTSWRGLGRGGVLEDVCDADGSCSQDGQGFKGLYFHHFTLFCEPLPLRPKVLGVTFEASTGLTTWHTNTCKTFADWVTVNAAAALSTRDAVGRFGMWWSPQSRSLRRSPRLPDGAVDYRNAGINDTKRWGDGWAPGWKEPLADAAYTGMQGLSKKGLEPHAQGQVRINMNIPSDDPNSRGRGRTVETQGSGMSVVRAMWEFGRI
jgi:predicted alpha-1,6-mannanase (GH76 family)